MQQKIKTVYTCISICVCAMGFSDLAFSPIEGRAFGKRRLGPSEYMQKTSRSIPECYHVRKSSLHLAFVFVVKVNWLSNTNNLVQYQKTITTLNPSPRRSAGVRIATDRQDFFKTLAYSNRLEGFP